MKQFSIYLFFQLCLFVNLEAQTPEIWHADQVSYNRDSFPNPFITQLDTISFTCDQTLGTRYAFQCVTNEFNTAQTPIYLDANIDVIQLGRHALFFDSTFIFDCLQDTQYFATEPSMRNYGYFKGKILDRNEQYILCLIPQGYSVGFNYYLYTFTNRGVPISKCEVAGRWIGEYEKYGTIKDKNNFEIIKHEISANKESGEWYIRSKKTYSLSIKSDGQFSLNYILDHREKEEDAFKLKFGFIDLEDTTTYLLKELIKADSLRCYYKSTDQQVKIESCKMTVLTRKVGLLEIYLNGGAINPKYFDVLQHVAPGDFIMFSAISVDLPRKGSTRNWLEIRSGVIK